MPRSERFIGTISVQDGKYIDGQQVLDHAKERMEHLNSRYNGTDFFKPARRAYVRIRYRGPRREGKQGQSACLKRDARYADVYVHERA